MDSHSLLPRRLGEALGRAPRRRAEQDSKALQVQEVDHAAHDSRLARAGATCQHEDAVLQNVFERFFLLVRELDARNLLPVRDERRRVRLHRDGIGVLLQVEQLARCFDLRAVEVRRVDERLRANILDSELLGLKKVFQDLAHRLLLNFEEVCCLLLKRCFRDAAVPLLCDLLQGKVDTRRDATAILRGDAEALRDGVRDDEADAFDLAGQLVRVIFEGVDGEGAVLLEDARRIRARDVVCLQPEHDVAELRLRGVRGRDLLDGLLADARDLAEAVWRLLDDGQRFLAELLHDALGQRRADAVDDAGGQEALNALGT